MKTFLGVTIALVILRIAESVYDGRVRQQTDFGANNLIDVDGDVDCPKGFTGQIPYAIDCRQYLNCWKGRGTIQSCAPGTMFNPKSMECDHPSKVKCQRFDEFRESPALIRTLPNARIECEPNASGLFAHPSDCAKFLNCNNGVTVIQDCGPGTNFNARLKVCDWPQNTDCANRQGSSGSNRPQQPRIEAVPPYYGESVIQARMHPSATGAPNHRTSNNNFNTNSNLKYPSSVESVPLAPYGNGNAKGGYGRLAQPADTLDKRFDTSTRNPSTIADTWPAENQLDYESQPDIIDQAAYDSDRKRIKCKPDWVGLYPHPFDCRKFLNCNNGVTFIQDCGPGTAFNPTLQVCDWPHNVNCPPKSVEFDELSQAETKVQHVTAQPSHATYPLLPPHGDGEFKKYFYDDSQLKQTGPSISANVDNNLNTQSTHGYSAPSIPLHERDFPATNIDEYLNAHTATHNVNHDSSYQNSGANRKHGQNPVLIHNQNTFGPTTNHGAQSSTNQNSFTVANQYGTQNQKPLFHRVNDGIEVSESVQRPNKQFYGQTGIGENTLINTQYAPANTPFNRIDEHQQQNTQFFKQTTGIEGSQVNGASGDIFGNNPNAANPAFGHQGHIQFNQNALNPSAGNAQNGFTQSGHNVHSTVVNTPSQRTPFESKQIKWNAQNDFNILNDKNRDVKTNLISSDDKESDRNGKTNPKSQFDDSDIPPFASETGFIGECSVPGLIKHPYDCSKFVNCENEKAYEQSCAPGTLFNPVLKICDFARKVNCTAGPPLPQQFGISDDLQPPKFNMNEPSAVSISNGYSKTTKNTPKSVSHDPPYQPPNFSIPDMSVLPLSHTNDGSKYPAASEEDDRKEPTTPSPNKPRPIHHPNVARPSLGTDTIPDDIETNVQQIQRPGDPLNHSIKLMFVDVPAPQQLIPKEKEHIMPIYQRRTTTPAPTSTLSIQNQYAGQSDYNTDASDKKYASRPIDEKVQSDFLPLNEALKLLLRPYANEKANETSTGLLEKKILEIVDKNNDTKTDHTAAVEQSSLAHALFNENDQQSVGADYDYFGYLNYDRKQKHDQNCQHYHPPSTFFQSLPNYKHSPEFHEYMNRKHALSNKEFYVEEQSHANTPSNVELLPGAALHQHGYHHAAPPAPLHHHPHHHQPHHPHQHHHQHQHTNDHGWSPYPTRSATPTTNSLAAPDSYSQTTTTQFTNAHSSRAFTASEGGQCADEYNCQNGLCVPFNKVCDGRNDCGNRYDESACQHVGYEIRLSNERGQKHMGRIEVKAFGRWGYVCDDKFGMDDANVVCRELGYKLGAAEVKSNSYYAPNANMSTESMFMMDEVNCSGIESSLRECDFNGWGNSDCNAEEVVGVVCKMPVMKCPSNYFLCEASEQCIPINFMCDGVSDCSDGADEASRYCNAPIEYRLADGNEFEGRVEVKYRGIWGTVCDDDFGEAEATVLCHSLGYDGQAEISNERIGYASGPIWLDQVSCLGNETCLDKCMHFAWGESNCNHTEDISIRCSHGSARKSAKLMQLQDHNSLSEFDAETQKYIREIQRSSKSMPDYSNVCGQVRVSNDDVESSAEMLGQFRVISGTRTKRGHHPWQATIRARGRNGRSSHWCGAVVLSKNHILTAAHCLVGFPKGAYFIRLGDHHSEVYEDSEVEIFIEDWFIHEEFRKGQHMNNDIAVILLKQPIQFSNYIQPICLPSSDATYAPDRNCTISGWGSIQYGKSTPSLDLKAATVPIISQDVCRQKHIYGDAIMETMFCAGYLDQSGVDACDGDSGGPLVCADQSGVNSLYGIISWGQRCGDSTKPGVYVKVSKFLDWIKDKMNANRPTRRT